MRLFGRFGVPGPKTAENLWKVKATPKFSGVWPKAESESKVTQNVPKKVTFRVTMSHLRILAKVTLGSLSCLWTVRGFEREKHC